RPIAAGNEPAPLHPDLQGGFYMTNVAKVLGAVTASVAMLLPVAAIGAGNMSRADFDRCNQQAMQAAGISSSPSASPTTTSPGASGSMSGSSTSGSMSSSTSSPNSVATSGTGISQSSPSGNTV